MAIMKMKRVEMYGILSEKQEILDAVQRNGNLEVTDYTECEDVLEKVSYASDEAQIEKNRLVVSSAIEVMSRYAPYKSDGLIDGFKPRPDMTLAEYAEKVKGTDATIAACNEINALYKEIQDHRVEIVRAETSLDQLKPWVNLDISSAFKGTSTTACFIGSIAGQLDREAVLTKLAEQNPDLNCEVEIVSSEKTMTCLVALCHKENEKDLEQALRNIGLVSPTDPANTTPGERIAALEKIKEDAAKSIAEKEEKLKSYVEIYGDISFLLDYFTIRKDKLKALDKISVGERAFALSGYIPEAYADAFVSALEKDYCVAIQLTDADIETEDVPVALKNNALGATMENVTKMYATPTQKDVDPNFIMTTFYYSLFGLMLGDAGYGILIVLVCLFVKFKLKPEPQKMKSVNYGLGCGIGTTVWGILLNGWFGDLPAYISNGLVNNDPNDIINVKHLYWFIPLDHTTRFLLLAFGIGILHLGLALCVNIYKGIKQHKAFDAIIENGAQILVLIGFIPLINTYIGGTALSENPPTKFLADFLESASGAMYGCLIAGAALIILGPAIIAIKDRKPVGKILGSIGGGLYGLYNAASGYLGDILSYARLLALGLCTGVIASVVNQLAAMLGNPILFVIVAIFGHAINFGINLIGTYVHTNRLQYVEFFGKFYEGGGTPYEPLAVNSKSFKFKEETQS